MDRSSNTGLTEHQFKVKQEQIKGLIRTEQVKQLELDLDVEKENTKQGIHKVNIAKKQTLIEGENLRNIGYRLDGIRQEGKQLQLQNVRKTMDINAATRENVLYQKTLELKYSNLETGYQEAKQLLENRRTELKQQGILE